MSDAIAWRYRLNEPGALWTYTLMKPRPKVFDLYEVQPLFGSEAAPEITELRAKLEAEQKLRQLVGSHRDDERRTHRRTREVLASLLNVEVDSEAYDKAYDAALAKEGGERE